MSRTVCWNLGRDQPLSGLSARTKGRPVKKVVESVAGIRFDGISDAIVIEASPLLGAPTWQVEAHFLQEPDGGSEQRFVHIQENDSDNRILLETRCTPDGWYADTFVRSGERECVLTEPSLLHPYNQWHRLTFRFDGQELSQYVDGKLELSSPFNGFTPLMQSRVSLGCRINEVSWFKGIIAEVSFSPR